ncbi:MAG: hypothetical protein KF871_12740 [Hydrogenophaga sp.]|uniref:hypothetical protein n=1 Tax=Hydrogenophaga sp. TaxID=1904254 RepID=UPI001D6DD8E4|nr:hypothetical protein [Hydrogenophaga sp.]MBX3610754.1 hypothetical protein [Hydrogenophaga sp.]
MTLNRKPTPHAEALNLEMGHVRTSIMAAYNGSVHSKAKAQPILNWKLKPRADRLSTQMDQRKFELEMAANGGSELFTPEPLEHQMRKLMQEHAARAGEHCIIPSDCFLEIERDPIGLKGYARQETISDGRDYSLVTDLLLACGEHDILDVILDAQVEQGVKPGQSVAELEEVDVYAFTWGFLFETILDIRLMMHAISKEDENAEMGYRMVRDYNENLLPKWIKFAKKAGVDVQKMGEVGKCRVARESAILHFDIPYCEDERAWMVFRDWFQNCFLAKELDLMVQRVLSQGQRQSGASH